jgi:hypothetical protein
MRKPFWLVTGSVVLTVLVMNFSSCYYDREDYLYSSIPCDTVANYNGRIKAIMDNQCALSGCHSGPSPEASLALTTYDEVKTAVADMGIMCNIRQESGCVPMPKNQGPISACDIAALDKWQQLGFPEN